MEQIHNPFVSPWRSPKAYSHSSHGTLHWIQVFVKAGAQSARSTQVEVISHPGADMTKTKTRPIETRYSVTMERSGGPNSTKEAAKKNTRRFFSITALLGVPEQCNPCLD